MNMIQIRAQNSIWGHVALLGGFGLFLYHLLNMLACCCCLNTKFENYLASELFTISEIMDAADKGEAAEQVSSSSMTMKRSSVPSG